MTGFVEDGISYAPVHGNAAPGDLRAAPDQEDAIDGMQTVGEPEIRVIERADAGEREAMPLVCIPPMSPKGEKS